MNDAAERKRTHYASLCETHGADFIPFIMNAWGGVHEQGRALLQSWGSLEPDDSMEGASRNHRRASWRRALSFALVKGVAAQLGAVASACELQASEVTCGVGDAQPLSGGKEVGHGHRRETSRYLDPGFHETPTAVCGFFRDPHLGSIDCRKPISRQIHE